MSYPKPKKLTVIGVQNMVRMVGGKSQKVQVPVVFYGKLPNTFLECKELCGKKRLSGTARCEDHVKQYN